MNNITEKMEISLIEESSRQELVKPTLVRTQYDFDFVGTHGLNDLSFVNRFGIRETVSTFSLGQLDSVEGGEGADFSSAGGALEFLANTGALISAMVASKPRNARIVRI